MISLVIKEKALFEDKLAGAINGTVHMEFGGEVHHMRRLELREHAVELVAVADVDLLELEPVGFRDGRQILQIAGVGELVDHADGVRRVVDDMSCYGRLDKSGTASYDDTMHILKSHDYSKSVRIKSAFYLAAEIAFRNANMM